MISDRNIFLKKKYVSTHSSPQLGAPLRKFAPPPRASTAKTLKLILYNFRPERYDDSSNGSIDDDEHGGVAPDVVHELGRCVPARALKSSGYCGGEVV